MIMVNGTKLIKLVTLLFGRIIVFFFPGLANNVFFPFDIMNDTSIDVAKEMVKELEIIDWEPVEIAKMIDGAISSLVSDWKYEEDDETPHDHHRHRTDSFHSSSSHASSSQASLSNYMARGLQDWVQGMESNTSLNVHSVTIVFIKVFEIEIKIADDLHDETYSQSSSHSGSYSNLNYIAVDEYSSQSPVMSRTHNMTRFCPEESSHLQSGQANAYAASSSTNRSLASDNRTLTRNRSLVDVQRQLLHRSPGEEARKRRLFKTVGDVETVGFQSPYAVSRKPPSSRR